MTAGNDVMKTSTVFEKRLLAVTGQSVLVVFHRKLRIFFVRTFEANSSHCRRYLHLNLSANCVVILRTTERIISVLPKSSVHRRRSVTWSTPVVRPTSALHTKRPKPPRRATLPIPKLVSLSAPRRDGDRKNRQY
jgi:hypothetical protein